MVNNKTKAEEEICVAALTKIKKEKSKDYNLINDTDLTLEVQNIFTKHKISKFEAQCILNKSMDLKHIKECYIYALTQNVDNIMAYMLSLINNYNKPQGNIKQDRFTDYEQRNYDFEELEKKLLGLD